ncbi:MAG: GerMN domain-containing protein [Acidimicrobiia bacterium]|nr:GerMN domain-containing protein [Acidimicrobiia bacterium]
MPGRAIVVGAVGLLTAVLAWGLFIALPRWVALPPPAVEPPVESNAPAAPERKIKARLFFVSDDGHGLTGVERDVAFGADPTAQARAILEAQLTSPEPPLLSAIPSGTTLRAVFVANGDAYVDVSSEIVSGHPGGTLSESLTIYTLVAAVKANLPAVGGVQILVNGKEVDTLAGHIDLRQPLVTSPTWVQ